MGKWFVYILECRDNSYYTGITNDLEKRMNAHEKGTGSKYVKAKGFGKLLAFKECKDKIEAAKFEYQVKNVERNKKIKLLKEK